MNKVIELAEEKAGKLDQYMEAGKQEFLDALEEAKKSEIMQMQFRNR